MGTYNILPNRPNVNCYASPQKAILSLLYHRRLSVNKKAPAIKVTSLAHLRISFGASDKNRIVDRIDITDDTRPIYAVTVKHNQSAPIKIIESSHISQITDQHAAPVVKNVAAIKVKKN
jgi:hypothetical protein